MPQHGRVQRNTLTYAQMEGQGRVQRNTLTYAQMEGQGIFGDIWKWVKKHKVISRGLKIAGAVGKFLPIPGASIAGTALGLAGTASGLAGYGMPGGKYCPQMASIQPYRMRGTGKAPKAITKAQVHAIASGLAHWLPSGGISLEAAKYMYPKIKNVLPSQVKGLAEGLGRMMKGGGLSLAGGKASGLYIKGMGYSGRGGYHGGAYGGAHKPPMRARVMPVNLAISRAMGYAKKPVRRKKPVYGSGLKLAGQGGRKQVKKKRVYRTRPKPVYRIMS